MYYGFRLRVQSRGWVLLWPRPSSWGVRSLDDQRGARLCELRGAVRTVVDWEAMDFFRDDGLVADPYPYFDALRGQCPVRREPHHGVVMVTGYDEAVQVRPGPARAPQRRLARAAAIQFHRPAGHDDRHGGLHGEPLRRCPAGPWRAPGSRRNPR